MIRKVQIDSFKDQIQLIDSQIQQLLNSNSSKYTKQQLKQKQIEQNKSLKCKINNQKLDFMLSQVQIKDITKQLVINALKKIIKIQQIDEYLQNNCIYYKLSKSSIECIKQMYNNMSLSPNAHRINFHSIEINFEQLFKSQFTKVQWLWFNWVQISVEDFKSLILNLNQIFPNLKVIQLNCCRVNNGHWKVIVDHVQQLKNIQAFQLGYLFIMLDWNQIKQISEQDLQKLLKMKQLKFLNLKQHRLQNQNIKILQNFKQNNQQIKILF